MVLSHLIFKAIDNEIKKGEIKNQERAQALEANQSGNSNAEEATPSIFSKQIIEDARKAKEAAEAKKSESLDSQKIAEMQKQIEALLEKNEELEKKQTLATNRFTNTPYGRRPVTTYPQPVKYPYTNAFGPSSFDTSNSTGFRPARHI